MQSPFIFTTSVSVNSYPRAIVHIDGDSFFASCEVARNPALRGKPVVTGRERGIASAMTYEAKARGVSRGMRISDILKVCPDAIILSSDYETYSIYSHRMCEIVRRYTPIVEQYSIDECFAEITGLNEIRHEAYDKIITRIKHDLDTELGMTFSIGLAPTKVLAKVASKWSKPSGNTCIPLESAAEFLSQLPIEKVWGIGRNTSALLQTEHILTALDFATQSEDWVLEHVSKPYVEIWHELQGKSVFNLVTDTKHTYASINKTRTFTPPSKDRGYVFSQLSQNIENACAKLRRFCLVTPEIYFFLKTQDFTYSGMEIQLPCAVSVPEEIISLVHIHFHTVYKENTLYRATGVTLRRLGENSLIQMNLFDSPLQTKKHDSIHACIDILSHRFGKHTVFLGSSLKATKNPRTRLLDLGKNTIVQKEILFKGETLSKRLAIPMLGEAC